MTTKPEQEATIKPLTFEAAKHGAIVLQKKYTTCTKRRECPPIFLVFSLKKAPSKSSGPHRLLLPNPVRHFPFEYSAEHPAVVFVTGESAKWQAVFDSLESPLKLKAISMSMLKKKLTTRKSRDELLRTTPLFFCEHLAAPSLPSNLGTQFFSRTKQPIIVNLNIDDSSQIYNEIKNATEATEFYIKTDTRLLMRIGDFTLTFDQLGENIANAAEQAMSLIPKSGKHVETMGLITSGIEIGPIWDKNPKKITLTAEDLVVKSVDDEDE